MSYTSIRNMKGVMAMVIYKEALCEMMNNFNNKELIIINRNTNTVIYKGKAKIKRFDFNDEDIVHHIFIFGLNNGKFITFDFEDAIYVKLNKNDEYGMVYEKYLFLVKNLKKENIENYIKFQNSDFTNNDIEDILYENI